MNPSQISNIQEFAGSLPLLPSAGRGGDLAVDSCAQGLLLGPVALGGTMSAHDFRQLSTDPFASETPGRAASVAQSTLPSFDSFQMEVGQPPAVGGALGLLAQGGAHGGLDFLDPSMDPAGTQDDLDFLDRLEGQAQISMGGLEALPPLDLQSFTVNGAGALDHIPVEEEAEMERPLEEIAPEDLVLPDDPTPLRRTARGRPKKSKKMFLRLHPMSVQWDVSKNGPIPDKLTSGSGKKYWWKCGKGHSWQARVADRCRIKQPKGCPKCARSFGGRLVKEHALANQWDVSKNGPIPEDLTCGSNKRVWWQCEKEHSWETRVLSRCKVKNHPGCPKCMGKSSHRGFVKDHKVAAQWDVVRNGQIPEDLTCGSNKRVWWKCEKRHSWQARVRQRCHLKKPSGCPKCAGKAPARGFVKDHPAADQWDVFKNGPLPDDLSCGMNQKFFWKCEKGHSWQAMVRNRCHLKKPSGCPTCSKSKKRAREADERVQQPLKKK